MEREEEESIGKVFPRVAGYAKQALTYLNAMYHISKRQVNILNLPVEVKVLRREAIITPCPRKRNQPATD